MSEPLNKIRIKIAERDYPMTVTAEQEARLRAAGRVLNERIKQFRDAYGLPDQDVLPMIALEAVADQLLAEQQRDSSSGGFHQRLEHLHELLLTVPTGPAAAGGGGTSGRSETGNQRATTSYTGT
ncbi:MAG: cell division protein ZapA [Hymenobacteraceae bacterium]|nr:cell division protein ZapA [Hymenobacteraceae bacterium]